MPGTIQMRSVIDAFLAKKVKNIRQYHSDGSVLTLYESIIARHNGAYIDIYGALNTATTRETYKQLIRAIEHRNVNVKFISGDKYFHGVIINNENKYPRIFPFSLVESE